MKNICFYYQVWYTNKRSTYEALKRFRKVYPNNELILVIAGLSQNDIDPYHKDYTEKLSEIFNITTTDYITIEEFPQMLGSGLRVEENEYRDIWYDFSILWLDKMVKLPSESTDILVACSDDWMILEEIPFNFDADASGMIGVIENWMEEESIKKSFPHLQNLDKFIWWPAHGHYMNFKKFKQGYNEENKKYMKEFVLNSYAPNVGMFTDFVCGLWILYLLNEFVGNSYITQYDAADHVVIKYGGKMLGDEQFVDEYPEDIYQKTPFISLHSYKTFRNMPISNEMEVLGIK
jgi:hypothetical protein